MTPRTTLAELLEPGRVVVLGELHGAVEHPAAIAEAAAAHGDPLWIGLEISNEEQPYLNAFLGSDGGAAARADLLSGPHWASEDGRSSRAMLDLVERVRALRAAGAAIELEAFDGPRTAPTRTERDATMADAIAAAVRPDRALLVLAGNLHALLDDPPFEIEPGYVPMAAVLVERGVDVVSILAVAHEGETWGCQSVIGSVSTGTYGVHPYAGEDRGDEPFVAVRDEPRDGYHGELYTPTVTASPPARS
jgi:hypothetical protein